MFQPVVCESACRPDSTALDETRPFGLGVLSHPGGTVGFIRPLYETGEAVGQSLLGNILALGRDGFVADLVYTGRVCIAFHATLHEWLMPYRFGSTKMP